MLFTQTVGRAFDFTLIAHGVQQVARGGGFAGPQIAIEAHKERLGLIGAGVIKRNNCVREHLYCLCSRHLIFTMYRMVYCQARHDLVCSDSFRNGF